MSEVLSARELYETILSRSSLPLPGLEEEFQQKAWKRAYRIHDYLLDRSDRLDDDCMLCEKKKARNSVSCYVHETPWDDDEVEKHFCSEECMNIYVNEEPRSYFWCNPCGREISRQNPRNGWHIQYREYEGEEVCLRCYENMILMHGVEREKLEAGRIPGMFFSFGNTEPLRAGYSEVPEFTSFFVRSEESKERFRKKALELIDQGKKVVIGYERMGIGGGEGYVTLMVKDKEKPRKKVVAKHAL
jgi:hypothetical protein